MTIEYSRLHSLTARQLIAALQRDGFAFVRQKGSHRHYRHQDGRRVTLILPSCLGYVPDRYVAKHDRCPGALDGGRSFPPWPHLLISSPRSWAAFLRHPSASPEVLENAENRGMMRHSGPGLQLAKSWASPEVHQVLLKSWPVLSCKYVGCGRFPGLQDLAGGEGT